MNVLRVQPFGGYGSLLRGIQNTPQHKVGFSPRVEVSHNATHVTLRAELPGLSKEDVQLTINDGNLLTFKGTKTQHVVEEGTTIIRNERTFGSFSRTFVLPENINTETINATFENGVLTVNIEKVQPEKPKELQININ